MMSGRPGRINWALEVPKQHRGGALRCQQHGGGPWRWQNNMEVKLGVADQDRDGAWRLMFQSR